MSHRAQEHQPSDGILTAVKPVLEIVVVAMFLVTFLVQPFRIPSESMEPTLLVGDFLLVDKQSFAPTARHGGVLDRVFCPPVGVRRGDLVVFHDPLQPNVASAHLVKRVIGLPGDRLRLRDGRVLIDEVPLREPYAFYSASRPNNFRDDFPSLREADPNVDPLWWIQLRRTASGGELTVPPGHYFVLGDNRNDSEDSRYWGFVPGDAIVGRPLVVYFSVRPATLATWFQRLREQMRAVRRSFRILR